MGVKKGFTASFRTLPAFPGFRLSPERRSYASDWKSAHAPYPDTGGLIEGVCLGERESPLMRSNSARSANKLRPLSRGYVLFKVREAREFQRRAGTGYTEGWYGLILY